MGGVEYDGNISRNYVYYDTLQDFSTEVAFLRPIVRDNKPIKIKPKPDDDPSRASDPAASLTNLTM